MTEWSEHLKKKKKSHNEKNAKSSMSEKYPACDHRNKTLYFINTSGVIWQKEFDVEKCETFTEAKGKKKKISDNSSGSI